MLVSDINIAIDGFSACGKSTLARDLASALNYRHIDSGSMYRAITLYFLERDVDYSNPTELAAMLREINLDFSIEQDANILTLNGIKQGSDLRSPRVDKGVSAVAALESVRNKVVAQQQIIGRNKRVVMDGRDIGSVVFPSASLKIFLEARLETRVKRRHEELLEKGLEISLDEVKVNLRQRDHFDTSRQHSPLIETDDAVVLDNTNLSRTEQLQMVLALAKLRISGDV